MRNLDVNIYIQGLQQFCYKCIGFNYRVTLKCITDIATTETWYDCIHIIASHNITWQTVLRMVNNITLGPYTEFNIRCMCYTTMCIL